MRHTTPWPDKCYMQVFVDGLLQYTYTTANRVQPFNLDDLAPSVLAGIEVYRGAAETPSEFNGMGSACGTIAIWTRTGPHASESVKIEHARVFGRSTTSAR